MVELDGMMDERERKYKEETCGSRIYMFAMVREQRRKARDYSSMEQQQQQQQTMALKNQTQRVRRLNVFGVLTSPKYGTLTGLELPTFFFLFLRLALVHFKTDRCRTSVRTAKK